MRDEHGPDVATIRARLAPRLAAPSADAHGWAATALVIGEGPHGPGICFIHRADRAGDRWSGQMALPGGRRDPEDPDLATTARREAFEEVGLELPEPLGHLGDVGRHGPRSRVAAFVFTLEEQPPLIPEPAEVQDALWIPLRDLLDPGAAVLHEWAGLFTAPGIRHGERVIWGLTHQILEQCVARLDLRLPPPR